MIENLTNEVWMPVFQTDDYTAPYEISNLGRVKNAKHDRLLKFSIIRGHERFTVYRKRGKPRNINLMVARLVLLSFVGPGPDDKPFARHRNGIGNDNRLTNLIWSDRGEIANSRDFEYNHHVKGDRQSNAKYTWGQVNRVRELQATGMFAKQIHTMLPEINLHAIKRFMYRQGAWDLTQVEQRTIYRRKQKLKEALNESSR